MLSGVAADSKVKFEFVLDGNQEDVCGCVCEKYDDIDTFHDGLVK